jgi:hypothetical protein
VVLRNADGEQRKVLLSRREGQDGMLAAPVAAGALSLAGITVEPQARGEIRLVALEAQVAPAPGVFGTAWKQGDRLLVRIYNFGGAAEHVRLETNAAEPLVEADLGPQGAALLRLPLTAFPGSAPPAAISIRWSAGTLSIPVQ